MSPESQRIAIAEACGWTGFIYIAPDRGSLKPRPLGLMGKGGQLRLIPDYLNDLNAMHEAEKVFDEVERVEYVLRLNEIVRMWSPIGSGLKQWDNLHATAAQRSEAFLKTIGKWEEAK